jgi:hypothetical protein
MHSIKTTELMLFRERISIYTENFTEHINILRGQNVESLMNRWCIMTTVP